MLDGDGASLLPLPSSLNSAEFEDIGKRRAVGRQSKAFGADDLAMREVSVVHRKAIPGSHFDAKYCNQQIRQTKRQRNPKVNALLEVNTGILDRLVDRHHLITQHKLARFILRRWVVN